jgi:hypothetical protein
MRMPQILIMVLLSAPISSGSDAPAARSDVTPKKAWDWTVEERLSRRFDPAARSARIVANERALNATHKIEMADVLNGSTPELFLPGELFDFVVHDLEKRLRGGRTMLRDEVLRAAGFEPSAFWQVLQESAARYVAVRQRANELADFADQSPANAAAAVPDRVAAVAAVCESRYEALQAARSRFGTAAFDRLLYERVAPGAFLSYSVSAEDPDYETTIRRQAEGCR